MFFNVHWPTVGASVGLVLLIVIFFYVMTRPKAQQTNYNYPGTL